MEAIDPAEEEKALRMMMYQNYRALCRLGWKPAIHCPKDGTEFLAIEAGSSGIHRCVYFGQWPKGEYLVIDEDGSWPSQPILFKPIKEGT